MIYKVAEGYAISSGGSWLEGCYEDERAAKYAFRFPDKALHELQQKVGAGVITFGMLQDKRKELIAKNQNQA